MSGNQPSIVDGISPTGDSDASSSTSGSNDSGSTSPPNGPPYSAQHRSISRRGRMFRRSAASSRSASAVMSGGRGVIPAQYVPEDLINQAQVVLQGKPRSAIVRELQRTNLDVNSAVINLLGSDNEEQGSTGGGRIGSAKINTTKRRCKSMPSKRGLKNSTAMQQNHLFSNICNCQHAQQTSNYQTSHPTSNCSTSTQCCPMSSVHNRYKPVTKKNIYSESDFFHDGIMEYIEYELLRRGVLGVSVDYVDTQ